MREAYIMRPKAVYHIAPGGAIYHFPPAGGASPVMAPLCKAAEGGGAKRLRDCL